MRIDGVNTASVSLKSSTGSVSMRPVIAQGERGEQGLPGNASAAWTASSAVTTGTVRQAPDGSWIKSLGSRTTRATFDATEQTFWEATLASAGTIEATALATSTTQSIVAATPAAPVDGAHIRAIPFGTSQEAANGAGTSTRGVESVMSVSNTNALPQRGWANWTCAYLDHQFYTDRNAGVGGNRYDQMLTRISTDVLAYPSEWVWMGPPVNDVTAGRTFAQIQADLDAMLALLLADRRKVALYTCPASITVDTSGERTVLAAVNAYMLTLPALFPGRVVVADVFALMSDTSTVQPLTNLTFDGTHYSDVGAHLIGRAVAEAVRSVTPPPVGAQTSTPSRPALTQILSNPFLTSTGWSVSATATASWAVPGRVSLTYSGISTANLDDGVFLTTPLGPAAGYAAGDQLKLRVKVKWKRAVPLTIASGPGPSCRIQTRNIDNSFTDPIVNAWQTASGEQKIPDRLPPSGELTLETPWLTTGPNVDKVYLRFFFSGISSAWVEFSDPELLRKAP